MITGYINMSPVSLVSLCNLKNKKTSLFVKLKLGEMLRRRKC